MEDEDDDDDEVQALHAARTGAQMGKSKGWVIYGVSSRDLGMMWHRKSCKNPT